MIVTKVLKLPLLQLEFFYLSTFDFLCKKMKENNALFFPMEQPHEQQFT